MVTKLLAYVVAAVLAPALALAAPITSLYVVGDSLSDSGNAFILTGGFPPPPYEQRASNGPVAAEYLAAALGVPLAPAVTGGTNFAVVGAATGPVGIPSAPPLTTENVAAILYGQAALSGTSLLSQTGAIVSLGPIADPDALFLVWGGANDLFINPSGATVVGAINNLATVIQMLYGIGARQFLVPNLPDLSRTPAGLSLSPIERAGLEALSVGFNAGLAGALNGLSVLPGIDIELFDTFGLFNAILANPSAFGFSNVSIPCITGNLQVGGSVCADAAGYLFWDSVHPTTAAHGVLGNAFAAAVAEPVPEPASLVLLSLGIGLATAARRRRTS